MASLTTERVSPLSSLAGVWLSHTAVMLAPYLVQTTAIRCTELVEKAGKDMSKVHSIKLDVWELVEKAGQGKAIYNYIQSARKRNTGAALDMFYIHHNAVVCNTRTRFKNTSKSYTPCS